LSLFFAWRITFGDIGCSLVSVYSNQECRVVFEKKSERKNYEKVSEKNKSYGEGVGVDLAPRAEGVGEDRNEE